MDQFVTVRIIQGNGLDLSLFQFDFDLTFAIVFMNPDRTIYGRYGTRSDQKDATRDISLEGLGAAMRAVLDLHKNYPANLATLKGKTPPPPKLQRPEMYPTLKTFGTQLEAGTKVARSCMHCHMIPDAERKMVRDSGQPFSDQILFPWPKPDILGLTLDPTDTATVKNVIPDTPAARAGFRKGDKILTAQDQALISIADVQWVLHHARDGGTIALRIERDGQEQSINLALEKGWRARNNDISWRTTSWDLRRMATGGILLKSLTTAEQGQAGLGPNQLGLRAEHVGQYGEHATAQRAGFRKDDIIVSFDGRTDPMTETGLFAHVLKNRMKGRSVPVVVLRNGARVNLQLPLN